MHPRIAALRETRVLRPFSALLGAQLIGSGLGFVYWVVAARFLAPETIGVAAAAISTQALMSSISMLGLGTLMLGELKTAAEHERRGLIVSALATAAAAGGILGALVMVVSPSVSENLRLAFDHPLLAAMFVLGVGAQAVGLVLDQSVLGLDRPHTQVWRNLVASGLRFPIAGVLLLMGYTTATVVVFSWVAAVCVSIAAVWPLLGLRRVTTPGPRHHLGDHVARMRRYWRPAMSHHLLNLSLSSGVLLVPVVASVVLAPRSNGEFAVAWLIATFVFLPPYLLATALFAVSVKGTRSEFATSARQTLPAGLALSGALCLGTWLLGPLVLGIFGDHYAEEAGRTLGLLVLGGLWMVLKDHLVAYARVVDRLLFASSLTVVGVGLELVGASIGGLVGGQLGLVTGWLLVLAAECLVGVPLAVRLLRTPDLSPTSKET